ncbi:unnamed protein product [Urochloa humidicola]
MPAGAREGCGGAVAPPGGGAPHPAKDGGRLRAWARTDEGGRRCRGEDSSAAARRRPATHSTARRSSAPPPARARRILNAAAASAGTRPPAPAPAPTKMSRPSPHVALPRRSPVWRGGKSHKQIWAAHWPAAAQR